MKPIFRYTPKDTYLILYAFGLFLVPYAMAWFDPLFSWWLVVGFFHVWFIVNAQNSALHHHTHCPIFWESKYNQAYELFISAVAGIPSQTWRQAHLLHHKYVNDNPDDGKTKDPVSVYRPIGKYRSENGQPINFWIYTVYQAWLTLAYSAKTMMLARPKLIDNIPLYNKRREREEWAFRIYIVSVMLINFWYGLFLVFVYFLSYIVNHANSYGEHWGVLDRRGDTTQDSIGIYSWWYNWFGFNAGLHQEHHHKPGVHWTRLPEVTPLLNPNRKIVGKIHILNNPFLSHFKQLFHK